MKTAILIPARYQSSRYPGKPLVQLKGVNGDTKPLIQRSVEAARRVRGVSGVFVTTDDELIADACAGLGVGVIMTSPDCRNGTERCAEALSSLHHPGLVINFQGDALLTPPSYVEALMTRMETDPKAMVATPALRLKSDEVRALQAEEAGWPVHPVAAPTAPRVATASPDRSTVRRSGTLSSEITSRGRHPGARRVAGDRTRLVTGTLASRLAERLSLYLSRLGHQNSALKE